MNNMIKLWSAIDDVMQDNEYYDDELHTTICDVTDEQIYSSVVKAFEKEIKFLTKETIMEEIRRFGNWEYRHAVLAGNSLF